MSASDKWTPQLGSTNSESSSTDDFISPKGGQCDDFHPCPRCERSKRPPVTAALSTQPLSLPSRRLRSVIRSRSEEHTSELQSLMRISYAVFCLKKQKKTK